MAIVSITHMALGFKRQAVGKHLGREIPQDVWQRLTRGAGAKGQCKYDWSFVSWPHLGQATHSKGCLARRILTESHDHVFYFTYVPRDTPLEKIVQVAGSRWTTEECFEQAKQATGLDD